MMRPNENWPNTVYPPLLCNNLTRYKKVTCIFEISRMLASQLYLAIKVSVGMLHPPIFACWHPLLSYVELQWTKQQGYKASNASLMTHFSGYRGYMRYVFQAFKLEDILSSIIQLTV